MTMLADTERSNAPITLVEYETRIFLYKEQIGTGYIGIGRTLNEAKAAKVVPHGQWEAWVERTTGMNIQNAQRCMKAAREIKDGSALASLEMSKALALLSSGLDEESREGLARQAADEGTSLAALREAIRARQAAEKDLQAYVTALDSTTEQLDKAIAKRDKAKAEADHMRLQVQELKKQLDDANNHVSVVKELSFPADYEALKTRDAAAAARIREAEDYADAQEERVRALQAELDAARSGQGPQQDEGQAFIAACSTFYGEVCRYQNMTDDELLGGKNRADLMAMRNWAGLIHGWAHSMMTCLASPTSPMEVDGDVR